MYFISFFFKPSKANLKSLVQYQKKGQPRIQGEIVQPSLFVKTVGSMGKLHMQQLHGMK